jgi:hypothetical protein
MAILSGKFPEIGEKHVSGGADCAGGQDLLPVPATAIFYFYKHIQRIVTITLFEA